MRSPDRVQLEKWRRWIRARPWQVWATAGAVFVVFAAVGAVTRSPATVPLATHSLSDGIERGTGSSAAPEPSTTPEPGQPRYPGMAYPPDPAAPASSPVPTPTAYYPDCKAAEAAGAAPISRGRPGYRAELDRDGDGVACDTTGQPSTSPTSPRSSPTSPARTPTPTPSPTATASPTPSPTVAPTTEPPPPPGAG